MHKPFGSRGRAWRNKEEFEKEAEETVKASLRMQHGGAGQEPSEKKVREIWERIGAPYMPFGIHASSWKDRKEYLKSMNEAVETAVRLRDMTAKEAKSIWEKSRGGYSPYKQDGKRWVDKDTHDLEMRQFVNDHLKKGIDKETAFGIWVREQFGEEGLGHSLDARKRKPGEGWRRV